MSSHAAHPAQATPAAAQAAPAAALPLPFAGLAAELRLHAGDRAEAFGPVAAIQALILALLARLLGRLDALFASWQHGHALGCTSLFHHPTLRPSQAVGCFSACSPPTTTTTPRGNTAAVQHLMLATCQKPANARSSST